MVQRIIADQHFIGSQPRRLRQKQSVEETANQVMWLLARNSTGSFPPPNLLRKSAFYIKFDLISDHVIHARANLWATDFTATAPFVFAFFR